MSMTPRKTEVTQNLHGSIYLKAILANYPSLTSDFEFIPTLSTY